MALTIVTRVVTVPPAFIERGVAGCCTKCPLALAVNAMLDHDWTASVGSKCIEFINELEYSGCPHFMCWHGQYVREWIRRFDMGKIMTSNLVTTIEFPLEALRPEFAL
jgi:hypothetical protein